jgi:Ca2+-binding RTX toxin-like protein
VVNDAGIATNANYNAEITGTVVVADISTIDADTGGTISVTNVTDTFSALQTYNGASSANTTILQNALGTITANGAGNPDSADFSAVLKGMTINGFAGNDAITGTNFADVITGGTGADALLGGGGADIFVFATGDAPTSLVGSALYDRIGDFNTAEDRIDLGVTPILGSSESNAAATIGGIQGVASIDAAGKVTFSGTGVDDMSITEALVAVRSLVTGAGELAFFEFNDGVNGNGTFIYQENGASANDMLILLTGVTGITDFSTSLGDANTMYVY